jgi:hypothetical protein
MSAHAHTHQIASRVEAGVRIEHGIHPLRRHSTKEQGMSVGFRLGSHLGTDVAAGAGPIFDYHREADMPAHCLRGEAPHEVSHTARRIGHDDAQRPVGERTLRAQRRCGEQPSR